MTDVTTSQIPSTVNTVEKLAAWSLGILYQLHKRRKYQEADESPLVPLITAQDGLAADEKERVIFRVSLPMQDEWRTIPGDFYSLVEDLSNAPIPPSFLS
ncbi:MAG: hypothetical protein KME14_10225 [Tildeniella torsiva UHER 1998/13D]|jgi:hypothetical protein|nr:hypothetical protein [Tildeniella torsiva UHER 1998/13D]